MATASATIQLPESFFPVMKTKNANKFVRETLAVDMYREGKISPGKAKELAGARNKWEMLLILDRKGIPINYSAEDAEKDVKTLKSVLKRKWNS
ncbi:hypothetical protein BEH94_06740 [Candidatus Altiarchaeales archaeon WOR_SM1_SCG]|nr:hypothetical protein BEH94_06740 [Candidatus Altiarchaeales archaeon WOR_SM1_SCG]